jgi:D-arabinose 1-dehydrogenase-like Zn-dependent alcohol dehydrogenase
VPPHLYIQGRRSLIGWPVGTSIDSQDTLSFSVLSGVRSMNEFFPLERVSEAYDLMMSGKARFRVVLTRHFNSKNLMTINNGSMTQLKNMMQD